MYQKSGHYMTECRVLRDFSGNESKTITEKFSTGEASIRKCYKKSDQAEDNKLFVLVHNIRT
jgi:hypothetical protein